MVRSTSSNVLRRISTLLIISCLLTVGLCVNTAAALPGSGTQEDPWRIESLADFDEFAADRNYWSGFTRLQIDVNLAGRTYSTAVIAPDVNNSNGYFDGTAFTGVFDGNDHKIINLTIDDIGTGNDYLGLFGSIPGSEIKNLCIQGGSVSGDSYVGGLVGVNGGTVSNCYSTGSVSGGGWCVGGLLGGNGGSISNCYSTGDVNGVALVGGLVGENDGILLNCHSTGNVSGTYDYVGGLVGYHVGSISNCYSTGDVTGGYMVGGLVGVDDACGSMPPVPSYITNSYSTGDVNGVDDVGGLVGANGGSVSNCYCKGNVRGNSCVGGLVGINVKGSRWCPSVLVWECYSTGDVNGVSDVGGLVGLNVNACVFDSFWDVQTSGEPNMCGSQDGAATGCDPNCGKTTAQMQTRSTFTETGWDFVDIWLINEGATYPVLRQEIRSDLNGAAGIDLLDFAIFADHWLEGTGE